MIVLTHIIKYANFSLILICPFFLSYRLMATHGIFILAKPGEASTVNLRKICRYFGHLEKTSVEMPIFITVKNIDRCWSRFGTTISKSMSKSWNPKNLKNFLRRFVFFSSRPPSYMYFSHFQGINDTKVTSRTRWSEKERDDLKKEGKNTCRGCKTEVIFLLFSNDYC